jgi:GNAT superfamily N-acetyltransferase
VTAYRFCRSDDIGLLVDALNRCWIPSFPGQPEWSPATFKRDIRDLQVWCSSCMVAFAGPDPIGVLIGAKRPTGTLIHRIAVHPDHQQQGHGRHLLESLGSKLAILGPPRIVAEVPEHLATAHDLFRACGYTEDACLTDYVRDGTYEHRAAAGGDGFVIPFAVDDVAANGLVSDGESHVCWERSVEALTAARDDIAGLAVASADRIEAYVLYTSDGSDADILALRTCGGDGPGQLERLLCQLQAQGISRFTFSKVHPAEMAAECLDALGFRVAGRHWRYGTTARPD